MPSTKPSTVDESLPDISVIIPTYNESENLPILLERVSTALRDLDHEVVIVDDDSPDGTWRIAEDLTATYPTLRVIRRIDAKGLSSAVTTGMLQATGRVLAVMDADLQHDEGILPEMHHQVANEGHDVAVGSRETEGGSYGEWSTSRKLVSFGAKLLAKWALGPQVKDPMSGFFAISRNYFQKTVDKVNPSGFKILLEFLARGSNPSTVEVGYTFRKRLHGETKLNASIAIEYLLALIDLRFGWLIPNRFVKFGMVGITGSLLNFCGFAILQSLGASIPLAVLFGVELAIIWTYFANNFFTFTPMTYRGKDFFKGLLLYHFVGLYGLVIQFSVVDTLLSNFPVLSENLLSLYPTYMIGVAFAAIGNYFLHGYYTWNRLGFDVAKPTRRKREWAPASGEALANLKK